MQGFKDEHLGRSPGWWAPTVVTYDPRRPSQIAEENKTKHCEQVDENRCIHVYIVRPAYKVLSHGPYMQIAL